MFLVDWPGGSWQETIRLIVTVLAVYASVLWVALIFWVYRDIRQRTRDPIVQTVSVLLALVFFLPGHWVYLILRPRQTLTELYERSLEEETLLQDLEDQKACPNCRRRVRDDYLVCPSCRTDLKEPCEACAKPLDYGWVTCPYCSQEKAPRAAPTARVPRGRPPAAVAPGPAPPPPARARPTPARATNARSLPPPVQRPNPGVRRQDAPPSQAERARLIE